MKSNRGVKLGVVLATALLLLITSFSVIVLGAREPIDETQQLQEAARPSLLVGTLPNGVAVGDVTQTSAVLWARGTVIGDMVFEISTDPTFNTNVVSDTATVTTVMQPVKVSFNSLTAGTTYYYRATDAAAATANGQFRTPTAMGTNAGLRFGVSGDWDGALAPYPSISNADDRDLDFFVEHGDTIVPGGATTLADFRVKHNEVYSTHEGINSWADLRGSTAIFATIDDNEVRNDFAGGLDPTLDSRFDNSGSYINETNLFNAALDAFTEYNPIEDISYGTTGDPVTANKQKLYRYRTYGDDAAIFVLDTRSFRDGQLAAPEANAISITTFLNDSIALTDRTIFGDQQFVDLKTDLLQAEADGLTWKFIMVPDPIQNLGLFKAEDRFEGYAAERNALLRFIDENNIDNVVFISAGLHGTVVNNLTYQDTFASAHIPTTAFEVIAGPVAIDPPAGPFGPTLIDYAELTGLITPTTVAAYEAMTRAQKDVFAHTLMDDELITPLGYDPIGLDGSDIQATLLQGDYVAAHTYGWAEFEVHPQTQVLTVTIYGIDYYTETLLINDPSAVINRVPEIVTQFVVEPGPPAVLVDSISVSGPAIGNPAMAYNFDANVTPISATQPITYVWQVTDQADVVVSGDLDDSQSFTWGTDGIKQIVVTAQNEGSSVSFTHTIEITSGIILVAPSAVNISGALVGEVGISYNFDATVSPNDTTTPVSYRWEATEQALITQTNSLLDSVTYSWATAGTKTINVTAENLVGSSTDSFTIKIFETPTGEAKSLDRPIEPIVVRGSEIAELNGTPIDELFVYIYDGNDWNGQIPFQLDEKDADGYVASENNVLDNNDEIVFMAQDLGDRAPSPLSLLSVLPIGSAFYEIEVIDPLDTNKKGWAYIVSSDQLSITFTDDYVDYVAGLNRIDSDRYTLDLAADHVGLRNLTIGSSPDILDRSKLKMTVDAGLLGEIIVTEERIGAPPGAEPNLIKDGPIRTIIERAINFVDAGIEVDLGAVYFGYGEMVEGEAALQMDVPGFNVDKVQTSLDYNSNAVGSKFYNANVPGGVTVDGNPDAGVTTGLSEWSQLSHSEGRIIQVGDPANLGSSADTFYADDDTTDTTDTGDKKSYGESGFEVSEGINLNTSLNNKWYFLDPANGGTDNVGDTYNQYYFNPLDISSRLIAAIDSVEILGSSIGITETNYLFTAQVDPVGATAPITYEWSATEQTDLLQLNDNKATYLWSTLGQKTITVTTFNGVTPKTDVHTIEIVVVTPPSAVSIEGPATVSIDSSVTLTATTTPIEATPPLTYLWQATGQTEVVHSNDLSDAVTFTWNVTGTKTVTVSVMNREGTVVDTHNVDVVVIPLTSVTISGATQGFAGTAETFTATIMPIDATTPISYLWQTTDQTDQVQVGGSSDTVSYNWNTAGAKTIMVTAFNQAGNVVDTHAINIEIRPLANVSIAAVDEADLGQTITLNAIASPIDTTGPITYIWQATDQSTVIQSNNLNDSVSFFWLNNGTKMVTVTAIRENVTVQDFHVIEVTSELGINTLDRKHDAIIIPGSDIGTFIGLPISELFVYSHTLTGWGAQIPMQIDEVTASGLYTSTEDGLLDANDELVFMASHIGNQSPEPLSLMKTLPIGSQMYEIEVVDPLDDTKKGWAYLVHSSQLVSTIIDDVVDFNSTTDQIASDSYNLEFAGTHTGLSDLRLYGSGIDLLDRTKLRLVGDAGILGTITISEERIGNPVGSEPKLVKDGPVRDIVERAIIFDEDGVQVNLSTRYFAYADLIDGHATLFLDVPLLTLTAVRTSLDFNSNAVGSIFYNGNVPAGVTVDGDNSEANIVAQSLSRWSQISHSSGRLIHVSDPTTLGLTPTTYYKDDSATDPSDAGDKVSYSDVGFLVEDDINLTSERHSAFYIMPPVMGGEPNNVGASFEQVFFNPLQTEVTLLTVADDVTIAGADDGLTGLIYSFVANVSPDGSTTPFSYTWIIDDYDDAITQLGGTNAQIAINWQTAGAKTVLVVASNGSFAVTNSHTINIQEPVNVISVESVDVQGPNAGFIDTTYTFTATSLPNNATTPIAYTWQATDQPDLTQSNTHSDNLSYSWSTAGTKTITVTANNGGTEVMDVYAITISEPEVVTGLTAINIDGPLIGALNATYAFTSSVLPNDATTPIEYTWQVSDQNDVVASDGYQNSQSYSWSTPGLKNVVVTAVNDASTVVDTFVINILNSSEIVPLSSVSIVGSSIGEPNVAYPFQANFEPNNATTPIEYFWQATDQASVTQDNSLIAFSWITTGTKTVTVTAINGVSQVTGTLTIDITTAPNVTPLDTISVSGPATGDMNNVYSFTVEVGPADATTPVAYVWQTTDHTDVQKLSGLTYTQAYSWMTSGTKTIVVTAQNGANPISDTVTIDISAAQPDEYKAYLPLLLKQ
ncbi:MAG: alkaline phosphatase D family protein [Chloroflexota bacterium]